MQAPHVLADQSSASRVVDVTGLYLDLFGRALTMAVDCPHGRDVRPVLPMELGVSSMLDEIETAARFLSSKRRRDDTTWAYHEFLDEVDRVVPSNLDIHLLCTCSGAGTACITLPMVIDRLRFFSLCAPTEESWEGEINYRLGQRAARGLRGRTGEISLAIRRWREARGRHENAFAWICGAHRSTAS